MANPPPDSEKSSPLGIAGWIALAVMLGFLAGAVWYAVWTWGQMSNVPMSPLGWTFLVLGIVVTFAVGAGLMGLVFYSSRKNFDR